MDVDGGSFRRQHQSFPSASFRRPSHTTDVTPTTDDTSRQASLHLDFIIIGAGSSHVRHTILLTTDVLLHQESPDFLRHMRSLSRAIASKYLSKRVA
jgi:hypothetical protein